MTLEEAYMESKDGPFDVGHAESWYVSMLGGITTVVASDIVQDTVVIGKRRDEPWEIARTTGPIGTANLQWEPVRVDSDRYKEVQSLLEEMEKKYAAR